MKNLNFNVKTNAARLLDKLAIAYQLKTYEVDPEDLSAETVARKIGFPLEQVFKTLLLRSERTGYLFAVIPGNAEADEKAIAQLTGDRRVQMVPLKDVQPLTGYIRGGVTALSAAKPLPVYVEKTAELFDLISVSAGVRGTQILIAPADYLRAVQGNVAAIAKVSPVLKSLILVWTRFESSAILLSNSKYFSFKRKFVSKKHHSRRIDAA